MVIIVVAVALASVGTLTLLVRDRWHSPEVKPAEQARQSTTGRAAAAAGATVLPTDRKLAIEPAPAGPKQAQPPNPG
jgi:Flp pilus assembly protein CpaB